MERRNGRTRRPLDGWSLRDAGLVRPTITYYEQIHARANQRLGPDHPDTLTSPNNLAAAYQSTGHVPGSKWRNRIERALALLRSPRETRHRGETNRIAERGAHQRFLRPECGGTYLHVPTISKTSLQSCGDDSSPNSNATRHRTPATCRSRGPSEPTRRDAQARFVPTTSQMVGNRRMVGGTSCGGGRRRG